jgi:hypothetical protein
MVLCGGAPVNLLITKLIPNVTGEILAFRFSLEKFLVPLRGNIEVSIDVAVVESQIQLTLVASICGRSEDT